MPTGNYSPENYADPGCVLSHKTYTMTWVINNLYAYLHWIYKINDVMVTQCNFENNRGITVYSNVATSVQTATCAQSDVLPGQLKQ